MAEINITISKSNVYEEVAKTTAYIGSKTTLEDGKTAYEQVFVTDADLSMIERFYEESKDILKNLLIRFISEVGDDEDGDINWKLAMSSRFDTKMESSIRSSATSFIVNSIIGKWCEITANDKVKEYADNAAALLQDIKEKVYYKSKPQRVAPTD